MDIQVAQGALGPSPELSRWRFLFFHCCVPPDLKHDVPFARRVRSSSSKHAFTRSNIGGGGYFAGGEQRFVRVINTVAVHSVPQVGEGTRSILAQQDSVTAAGRSTTRREEDEVEVRTSRTNRVYKAREGIDNANRKSERDAERERERERQIVIQGANHCATRTALDSHIQRQTTINNNNRHNTTPLD